MFRNSIAIIVAGLNVPFGYTLTIWASATLAGYFFGGATPLLVLAFLGGAVGAYFTFAIVGWKRIEPVTMVHARRATLFNAVPIGAAGLVAIVDYFVRSSVLGYLLAGYTGTATYVVILSAVLTMHTRRRQSTAPPSPPVVS